ncbi:hypothetical protein [Rhodococcus rhodochrous]|jgi:hypothetical protein|uniref:hypothetical protein n=1 Tax=Rhodococcus rhodochrous TaxID=1829 RepID=UPI0011A81EA8|nr:hypothetical protein [Rhodococcus rhodochrous]
MVACSNEPGDELPDALVIDSSITEQNPVLLKLNDVAEFKIYYYTETATNINDGELVHPGGFQPNVSWSLIVDEEVEAAEGVQLAFRAKVELLHDGAPIDSYYQYLGKDVTKNAMVHNRKLGPNAYGWAASPYKAPMLSDGSTEVITSRAGTDFEFRFSEIEIGTESFTPSEIIKPSRPTAPTFEDTVDGQFNKLVYEKQWSIPSPYNDQTDDNGKPVTEERVPAFAIRSLFRQIGERDDSSASPWSPSQRMENWTTKWHPDLIAAGVEMLGDDTIKETWQRILDGNVERWFGNGTWIVGYGEKQVPPGTYQVTAPAGELIENGYWARTSPSGQIIDNDFVSSAQQVTVTIAPTDGQFETSRMGTWRPVN